VSKYCSSVRMTLFMITVVINLGPPLSIGRMRMRGWHDTESSSLVFIFLWSSLGSSALLLLTDYALKEEEIQREYQFRTPEQPRPIPGSVQKPSIKLFDAAGGNTRGRSSVSSDRGSLRDSMQVVPVPSHQHSYSGSCWALEELPDPGWQIMRRPKCWRRERVKSSFRHAPNSDFVPQRKINFLQRMKGCCLNCFARDHKRALCKDLMKCWICKRNDHTSVSCTT
jgi:hypothetical protein